MRCPKHSCKYEYEWDKDSRKDIEYCPECRKENMEWLRKLIGPAPCPYCKGTGKHPLADCGPAEDEEDSNA